MFNIQSVADVLQGPQTLIHSFQLDPALAVTRIVLIILGLTLMYLGRRGVLEAVIMIPLGLGMATVNAAIMFFDPLNLHQGLGTLFVESQAGVRGDSVQQAADIMTVLQIDWLQPIYTFTFSNGLIACLVFMGIGSLLDIGFILQRPYTSMIVALFAELGTFITLPVAMAFGFDGNEAASIAIIGGADGPMVLFASLNLAKNLFVPITVVAYIYLGLCYGGYPYLIKYLVPKHLRAIPMQPPKDHHQYTPFEKMVVATILCVLLSFLLPVAAPLFFSLFFGIVIRESGIKGFQELLSNTVLYTSTMFLGLMLGILCDANTILDPQVLPLLLLGCFALLFAGIGGLIGGYVLWYFSGGKINPVVGIAGVSCVPTTAKVAQKVVYADNPHAVIMPAALGASICGVITSAIITGVYITLFGKPPV